MNTNVNDLLVWANQLPNTFSSILTDPNWVSNPQSSEPLFRRLSLDLLFFNACLWNEEDLARRTKVADSEIAANKRAIDRFNQSRNDLIEQIDDWVLEFFGNYLKVDEQAVRSSETAGSMVDRISILSLKIHHMKIQAQRSGVSYEHRQTAQERCDRLLVQRDDLVISLVELLAGMHDGTRYFKVYRQFKMYNDPNLNPALVAERNSQG